MKTKPPERTPGDKARWQLAEIVKAYPPGHSMPAAIQDLKRYLKTILPPNES